MLRSLAYLLIFYPATLLWVLAALAASLRGPGPLRGVVRGWADFHHHLCRRLLGIAPEVTGTIPPGTVLIAVKHQAMYETLEIVRLAHSPVIVLKRELVDIPLLGAVMRRYGVVPVDRSAGPKALRRMLASARQGASDGRPVVIFPEGTRVPPGSAPPLRPGFAGLYRALGLPVVPVAVDSGRLWGRGLVKRPGTVRFAVGETIPPGLGRDEVEARVHAAINALEA